MLLILMVPAESTVLPSIKKMIETNIKNFNLHNVDVTVSSSPEDEILIVNVQAKDGSDPEISSKEIDRVEEYVTANYGNEVGFKKTKYENPNRS